jgi:hypothetical protein
MNCHGLRKTFCGTASGQTTAEIAAAVMRAKGMAADDAAFKEIVAARALTGAMAPSEARGSGEVRD